MKMEMKVKFDFLFDILTLIPDKETQKVSLKSQKKIYKFFFLSSFFLCERGRPRPLNLKFLFFSVFLEFYFDFLTFIFMMCFLYLTVI